MDDDAQLDLRLTEAESEDLAGQDREFTAAECVLLPLGVAPARFLAAPPHQREALANTLRTEAGRRFLLRLTLVVLVAVACLVFLKGPLALFAAAGAALKGGADLAHFRRRLNLIGATLQLEPSDHALASEAS